MRGAIPPLPQYAFMAWCLVKAQGQLSWQIWDFHGSEDGIHDFLSCCTIQCGGWTPAWSSETLVSNHHTLWCNNPEYHKFQLPSSLFLMINKRSIFRNMVTNSLVSIYFLYKFIQVYCASKLSLLKTKLKEFLFYLKKLQIKNTNH